VTGRVQGVFYRAWAREQAADLNLAGLARNEPDGTVYIIVEGEEDSMKDFIERCKSGSDSAEVISVEINWGKPSGNFAEFSIQ